MTTEDIVIPPSKQKVPRCIYTKMEQSNWNWRVEGVLTKNLKTIFVRGASPGKCNFVTFSNKFELAVTRFKAWVNIWETHRRWIISNEHRSRFPLVITCPTSQRKRGRVRINPSMRKTNVLWTHMDWIPTHPSLISWRWRQSSLAWLQTFRSCEGVP